MAYRILKAKKNIALIAHDNKKDELMQWALENKKKLAHHNLFATGTTGKLLEKVLGQPVKKYLSGPLGGDQQIGARIAEDKINVLIFFWDPMEAQPHDPDVKALLRLAATYNLPVATSAATADFLFTSPYMTKTYHAVQPDYNAYKNRKLPDVEKLT